MSQVLILNAGGSQVLGLATLQHAIGMLHRGVAKIHEAEPDATFGPYPLPRSVELLSWIYTKWIYETTGDLVCSRVGVMRRDNYTCAYCSRSATTWDHIKPQSRGGASSWLNCVAACERCNFAKDNKTPREAGMELQFQPYVPTLAELKPRKYR